MCLDKSFFGLDIRTKEQKDSHLTSRDVRSVRPHAHSLDKGTEIRFLTQEQKNKRLNLCTYVLMSKTTILLSSSSTQEQKNTRLNLCTYVLMSKTTILLSSSLTQEQKNTRQNLCTYVLMSKHIMLLSKPTKTVCLKTMWEIAKTISNIIGLI